MKKCEIIEEIMRVHGLLMDANMDVIRQWGRLYYALDSARLAARDGREKDAAQHLKDAAEHEYKLLGDCKISGPLADRVEDMANANTPCTEVSDLTNATFDEAMRGTLRLPRKRPGDGGGDITLTDRTTRRRK